MIVPDEIRKCTAFIGYQNEDGTFSIRGTAFFVSVAVSNGEIAFGYIVTAKHVIAKIREKNLNKVWLRINTHEGYQWVVTNEADWLGHPTEPEVDVAVINFYLSQNAYDYLTLTPEHALTKEIMRDAKIGIGDEVFLAGLFTEHNGRQKNLPILRTGVISMMPEEPIQTIIMGWRVEIDAYLIEARSIGGLSGSPVWVHLGQTRPNTIPGTLRFDDLKMFYWLGLMHGHWDTRPVPDDTEIDEAKIPVEERVNMGIAIVIPVEKILEVINQDVFKKQREVAPEILKATLQYRQTYAIEDQGEN